MGMACSDLLFRRITGSIWEGIGKKSSYRQVGCCYSPAYNGLAVCLGTDNNGTVTVEIN